MYGHSNCNHLILYTCIIVIIVSMQSCVDVSVDIVQFRLVKAIVHVNSIETLDVFIRAIDGS